MVNSHLLYRLSYWGTVVVAGLIIQVIFIVNDDVFPKHSKGERNLTDNKTIKPYAWVILAILFSAQLVMSMGSFSYGPLAPFLRDAFRISRAQVGSLIAVFYFTCTIAAIPAGIMVDRMGARQMLFLCRFLEGIPYAAMPLANSFLMIAVCSALSGIGYGFITQVSTRGIMNWFSLRTRATAMGIKQSGVTIGGASAAWVFPILSVAYGWETGVGAVGLSMFFMAFITLFFYREHPAEESSGRQGPNNKNGNSWKSLFAILSRPTLLSLLLITPFLAFSQGCVVSFLVLYIKEDLHFPVETAGMCMTAGMVAAALGRICWGVISDGIFAGDRLKPVIILSLVGAVSAAGMAALSPASSTTLVFFWSILLGFSISGWNAMIMVLSAELGGAELAASVVSVVITVIGVGYLIGPIAFGYVADHAGYFASWLLVVVATLFSLGGFLRIYMKKGGSDGSDEPDKQ
jgi:ACS family hexuronate transporter-like MFS transporter